MDRLELAEKILKRPRHCLLVDDDDTLRKALELGFEGDPGVKLTTAPHGEAALKMLGQGQKFDCVLLDLNLGAGHMDGVEVFKYVKNKYKDLPVGFLTGYPDDARFHEASQYGWFMVYRKPIDFDDLKTLICSLVKQEVW